MTQRSSTFSGSGCTPAAGQTRFKITWDWWNWLTR
jgi:hypothetical protein